jgi:hypothetical protein
MAKILRIPRTLAVVSKCWDAAEADLRRDVRRNHPGALEEVITDLFYGLFAERLRQANEGRSIVGAFVRDLQSEIPEVHNEAWRIASGLVADVTLHGRETEKTSGGDLGFVIVRPQVFLERGLVRVIDYRHGLLCQAKRKKRRTFGRLSESQKAVLPGRLRYLAILGYEFADRDGYDLMPFKWQSCEHASVAEVIGWLSRGTLPSAIASAEIIAAVGSGRLGTDDVRIINDAISPCGSRALEVRIHWPNGGPPDGQVRVLIRHNIVQVGVRA